jgi:hypothetical protein
MRKDRERLKPTIEDFINAIGTRKMEKNRAATVVADTGIDSSEAIKYLDTLRKDGVLTTKPSKFKALLKKIEAARPFLMSREKVAQYDEWTHQENCKKYAEKWITEISPITGRPSFEGRNIQKYLQDHGCEIPANPYIIKGSARRKSRKLGNTFNRCVKSVRSTVRARKGSTKESAAIAICTKSVLQTRGRTMKRYRKGRLITQKKFRGGGWGTCS